MDMRTMDRILSVNREQRIVIVEPGVTYEELVPVLEKYDLAMPMPLAPKAGKSVLASVTELEPRLNCMHSWNFVEPLRCLDVVWGDGKRMFTGAAFGPMDLELQQSKGKWQLDSPGPMLIDYYRILAGSCGTTGIANWASIRCEVLPKEHTMYFVASDDVGKVVAFLYDVIHKRFSDELLLVNKCCLSRVLGGGFCPENVPEWIALVGIAGRDKAYHLRVEGQRLDIGEIAQAHRLQMTDELGGVSGAEALKKISSPCAPGQYWKTAGGDRAADVFFYSTLDKAADFIQAARETMPAFDETAVYIQPLHQGICCQIEFVTPYKAGDAEKAKADADRLAETCVSKGGYFSRNYGGWAVRQLRDETARDLICGVKAIFDPEHIMNPGKLGQLG